MSKASAAEPEGPLPNASQALKERRTKTAKTRLMERQKMRGHESLSNLQQADSGVVAPYHEVDTELSEPHPKRRRSSTASSRSDSLSLHPEDSQMNHLCAARVESRADSLCSTQQPTTPTDQAGTPNRTCTSPSNHSDSGATEAAATAATAEATVAAAAATVAAAARVSNDEEKEAPLPSPLASPTPSLPSDAESCFLRPLLPPGLPVSHPCDSSLCADPPTELPRASAHQNEEGPCYCDVEGFLPGQGGVLLGAHYADIHTEKEYLSLPKRPIKIMTYTNSGGYKETMCVDEEEKAATALTEDASAAAASPPPSPAPSTAAEPPTATSSGAHQAATGAGSGGGYQRILWADEVIDASYRRKVWYRTDLHTFFSWLRSPSRHRPVKQRTYNARSLGYSEAKRLAFQFHPEECGDADFKKVYYLWKLKMKGKKKEEEAAAAALGCKDEAAAAAAATAGSTGEGSADAADALSAGGAEPSAPVQQPAQLKRGWGAKRRNTRQRGLIQETASEQQQQQQVPPVSAVARDVLSGSAGFCFSLSTPRQLRHLRDFGTISCAGLEDALFPSRNETSSDARLQAGEAPHAAEKAEQQDSLQVVGAAAWDFGAAGCITFAAPYEEDFEQQHGSHGTFNAASDEFRYQQQQQRQQQQQQQQQKYSQEEALPRRAEASDETLPPTNHYQQMQRRPQQRQSQGAFRRRLAEEEQRRHLIAQQQAAKQQREREQQQQQQQQQELERRQWETQQQDCQQHCYQHRHEDLRLQQQRQEQQKQLWQRQKAEAQRQLVQRYREEGMQHSLQGGTHQQQQARPHQRQVRQQQQQHRQQVAGGAQSRNTQQQFPFDALPQHLEDPREIERQQQLLQQQQQLERKQEEAAAAALAQRHQEIASLLQHLNPLARQRLEALLRSGALGKLSGPRAA
ncbi:hypothetical protein Emed_004995 [Eimeria media]